MHARRSAGIIPHSMTLDALKSEIGKLSPQERAALADWLDEAGEKAWDDQIRKDFRGGKLDELIRRAEKEFDDGEIGDAP
jgi:hypothetical protein